MVATNPLPGGQKNLAAEIYVSPRERELTPREAFVRKTAVLIKEGYLPAVEAAASVMAQYVPRGSVVVPVPSSEPGRFKGTLLLADMIAEKAGAIRKVLLQRRKRVPSSREKRRAGGTGLPAGIHADSMIRVGNTPPLEVPVFLIDNVMVSGATFEGARRALKRPGAIGLAYAWGREISVLPQQQNAARSSFQKHLAQQAARAFSDARSYLRGGYVRTASASLLRGVDILVGLFEQQGVDDVDLYRAAENAGRAQAAIRTGDLNDAMLYLTGAMTSVMAYAADWPPRGFRTNPDPRLRELERAWLDRDDVSVGPALAALYRRTGREQSALEVEAELARVAHYEGPQRNRQTWDALVGAYNRAWPQTYHDAVNELADQFVMRAIGEGWAEEEAGDASLPGGVWVGRLSLGRMGADQFLLDAGDKIHNAGPGDDQEIAIDLYRWILNHAEAHARQTHDGHTDVTYYEPGDDRSVTDWEDLLAEADEDEADEDEEGPAPGDYVLSPTGPLGSRTLVSVVEGSALGTFPSEEDACREIRYLMEAQQFWPNVWYESDHGNVSLYECPDFSVESNPDPQLRRAERQWRSSPESMEALRSYVIALMRAGRNARAAMVTLTSPALRGQDLPDWAQRAAQGLPLPLFVNNDPVRRRVREVPLLGQRAQDLAVRAVRTGEPQVDADHGGGVAGSYGYPATTQGVVIVALPDGRSVVWLCSTRADQPTLRAAALDCVPGSEDLWDHRVRSDLRRTSALDFLVGRAHEELNAANQGPGIQDNPAQGREWPWLSLREVKRWEPLATARGVSKVARSPRGFLTAYKEGRIDPWWVNRRQGFINRHLAQLRRGEPLWERDGTPTRRHLALIMWAYSPAPNELRDVRARRPNPAALSCVR